MAKNETALTLPKTQVGLQSSDIADLQRFVSSGFSEEVAFWIGDPSDGKKIAIYFGEIVGPTEPIYLERMGAAPDPTTGEVPMQAVPCYLFHPLDPKTFQPVEARTDKVICNAAVASSCKRYYNLASAQGGKAQVLLRWNGMGKSRKGFPFNVISTMFRIVGPTGAIIEAGATETPTNPRG